MSKLIALGIGGDILRWIEAFLSDRKQQVIVAGERSMWSEVRSGVPQGSVLGPILFVIFINDMPKQLSSVRKMFAADAKVYREVNCTEDYNSLQSDLDIMSEWSHKWQLPFNVEKCKCMHFGTRNPKRMANQMLEESSEERELGVIIDESLKFHRHAASAVIWGPHYKGEQVMVEQVQKRATKLIPCIQHLPYDQRLKILMLPSLMYRRRRGDMLQTFKIVTNRVNVNKDHFLKFNEMHTRGHQYKLRKPMSIKLVRSQWFSHRIVNNWNSLSQEVVQAKTVNEFKTKINILERPSI